MVKCLHKILFIAISFSFFVSATEMDLGECHNTFFDEYDTYVKTEHVSLDHVTAAQQEHNTYVLLYNFFTCYKALTGKPEGIKKEAASYYNHYPPKLFLRNSVWRIWFGFLSLLGDRFLRLPYRHLLYSWKAAMLFKNTNHIQLWTFLTGSSIFPFIINWSLVS